MAPNGSDLPTIGGRGPLGTANGGVDGLSRSRRRDIQCRGVDAIRTLRRLKTQDAARTRESMRGRWMSCRQGRRVVVGDNTKRASPLPRDQTPSSSSSFSSFSIQHWFSSLDPVCTRKHAPLFPVLSLTRLLLSSTHTYSSSFYACPCRVLVASMERSRRPWARPIFPSCCSSSRFSDLTALCASSVWFPLRAPFPVAHHVAKHSVPPRASFS